MPRRSRLTPEQQWQRAADRAVRDAERSDLVARRAKARMMTEILVWQAPGVIMLGTVVAMWWAGW